ncbi:restriction endonuclease subunit S [Flavobacterium sp. 316]|uniref:restriction endonuclease subunit S n=1 Tax=Flavobacterium sp. 316 TaxID=1603293 RepID=UPI0005FA6D28|nr:restriction endonuclease subunit S [Flavobacterium sp. 316]
MANKNKNPEVRFKGFTEDWKHLELGKVLTERKTMQKISEDAPILAFASGQGVIDRSERKSNNRDHLTLDQENKVYKLTELNDIVYNPSNLKYGAIDRNKHGRGVISPIYVTFTTEEEPSFIELIVKSEKFKLRALQYEEGTVVKRQSVSPENLLSLKVGISSSLNEQKKIGKLFDYIEDLINHHQKKYDKLVILKKAMLDKMFPKNGALIPEIRFKGFTDNWNEKTLGKISDISKGAQINKVELKEEGTYPVINGGITPSGYTENWNTIENTITISEGGNSCGFVNFIKTKFWSGGHCYSLGKISNEVIPEFLYQILKSEQIKIMSLRVGSGLPNIQKDPINNFIFLLPSPQEQKNISDYFKHIDVLISQHKKELKKLKNIKKACFSKMLVTQE